MNNTWWTNATTGSRTTLGGAMTAIGAVLLGASTAGITIPDWAKLLGMMLSAVGPIILGTQARQNNVTSEDAKAVQDGIPADVVKQDVRAAGGVPPTLKLIAFMLAASIAAGGCATYKSKLVDGTDGSSMTMAQHALFSKVNEGAATGSYHWGGDGSGSWDVGANSKGVDSTGAIELVKALIPLLQALAVPPLAVAGTGAGTQTPVLDRVQRLEDAIADIHDTIGFLKVKP